MSQPADIQPTTLEEILQILRNQAFAIPTPTTFSRYLQALDSLTAISRRDAEELSAPDDCEAGLSSGETNSSLIVNRSSLKIGLSLLLSNWLVNQWLMNTPYATASLYLDIISSLYGSAAKARLLPPTKLFSQLKADLKALGPEGWRQGINDQIFDRALRLTKNADHLIADDHTAAQMVIWSLTHSLQPLSQIALLKKNDLSPNTELQGNLSQGEAQIASKSQVGDLTIMPKPQASAWGSPDDSSVASERRFMEKSDANRSSLKKDLSLIVNRSSLDKRRYLFPLRQSYRTPKQLQSHINNIVNALFRRARLPQATNPQATIDSLWAYAALRAGIPASDIVTHLGYIPLGLPVLRLSAVASPESATGLSQSEAQIASKSQVGDLTIMPKPQASASVNITSERLSDVCLAPGFTCGNSERRFMEKSDEDRSSLIVNRSSLKKGSSLEEVGKIFLENPPQWYAMSLRPGVRFTQICHRIDQLYSSNAQRTTPDVPPELFYPSEEIARVIGKKIVIRKRPFIHSVVFFRAKLTDIGRLFSKIGDLAWCYRQSARPGAPYAHITDAQFRLFQQTIAQFTPDYEVAPTGELELNQGDRVEILGGLFAGHEATMEGKLSSFPASDLVTEGTPCPSPHVNNNTIYRLNIIGDNGIEWRINVNSRLLKPHP